MMASQQRSVLVALVALCTACSAGGDKGTSLGGGKPTPDAAVDTGGREDAGGTQLPPFNSSSDSDGDGISDGDEGRAADGSALDSDQDGTPDYLDDESDGDGIADRDEQLGGDDFDGDGVPNRLDPDSDGDGLNDVDEGNLDQDGDKWPAFLDVDSDQDGIEDRVEGAADFDGDKIPDYLDADSDQDGIADRLEGTDDTDGDGTPSFRDTTNDGDPGPVKFTAISTDFNSPIGIDYHQPTNTIVMSVNYSGGQPLNFERVEFDGTHKPFSDVKGLTDEVKIATVRAGAPGGFVAGDLFVGNGVDGQIVRITDNGATVINPWVDLPGTGNGLMRGSLHVDMTGVFGGHLIAVTTAGEVWRIDAQANPKMLTDLNVHLEGALVVPNFPARYGDLAGKILAGAEDQSMLHAIAADGNVTSYDVGVKIEDIDLVLPYENFFGVNYGTRTLLGVAAAELRPLLGDVLLTTEFPAGGTSGLFRLKWNGTKPIAQPLPAAQGSATVGQWEHVTFAGAGVLEVPLPDPPKDPTPPDPPQVL